MDKFSIANPPLKARARFVDMVVFVTMVAVAVTLAFYAVHSYIRTNADCQIMTVSVNMGSFSPNIVAVQQNAQGIYNSSTSNLSASYSTPSDDSTFDEDTITEEYDWSVTSVRYNANYADEYAPATSGFTDSISPTQPSSNSGATLTFTPETTGYWKVSVSCTVNVTDTNTNQSWSGTGRTSWVSSGSESSDSESSGSGNNGSQDLIGATATISPSSIITGADKNNPGAIYTAVTATVTPHNLASSVSVNNFINSGTGRAAVENSTGGNNLTGIISFDVYGTAGTSASMPTGDIQLQAQDGGTVLGTAEVTVIIPAAVGTLHPTFNGAVTSQNADLNTTTVPAYWSESPPYVELFTEAGTSLTITVWDQFGNNLSSIYNGQDVEENGSGSFLPINTTINNGQYSDWVGFYVQSQQTPNPCLGTSPEAQNWPNAAILQIPNSGPTPSDPQVQVAGFTLGPGIQNRSVTYNNGTLTITWP
jgi:hypothetical protein